MSAGFLNLEAFIQQVKIDLAQLFPCTVSHSTLVSVSDGSFWASRVMPCPKLLWQNASSQLQRQAWCVGEYLWHLPWHRLYIFHYFPAPRVFLGTMLPDSFSIVPVFVQPRMGTLEQQWRVAGDLRTTRPFCMEMFGTQLPVWPASCGSSRSRPCQAKSPTW